MITDFAMRDPMVYKIAGNTLRRPVMPTARDPRWVLLAESGEYSTLGRHREPDVNDLAAVEAALARVGQAGWLAVMSHSTHTRTVPEVVMVRPLRDPRTSFEAAVAAFRRRVA
jgi:hypothetical protein